ncbi:hypothetical protein [Hymenobacter ginkgonis]|uniref:hypothetical protein n=1 Tax=Hymenobacter ginkgonis TaxID=2682976 RepID=UPI0018DE79A4|nr:hypothetical protein [Hymenobacter ginkgonis]
MDESKLPFSKRVLTAYFTKPAGKSLLKYRERPVAQIFVNRKASKKWHPKTARKISVSQPFGHLKN